MVCVKSFLKWKYEEDHTSRQQAESVEGVILEQHVIEEGSQYDARVLKELLSEPCFWDHVELDAEVEVPLDVGGLDLDALFFILASLHTNHLVECNSHQRVHEHGRVQESNLKEAKTQQH